MHVGLELIGENKLLNKAFFIYQIILPFRIFILYLFLYQHFKFMRLQELSFVQAFFTLKCFAMVFLESQQIDVCQ